MQKWLKLNGTDFNIDFCSSLSLEDFKKEGENSFAKDKTLSEIKKIHETLIAYSKQAPITEISVTDLKPFVDGNIEGSKNKIAKAAGERNRSGSDSDNGKS